MNIAFSNSNIVLQNTSHSVLHKFISVFTNMSLCRLWLLVPPRMNGHCTSLSYCRLHSHTDRAVTDHKINTEIWHNILFDTEAV